MYKQKNNKNNLGFPILSPLPSSLYLSLFQFLSLQTLFLRFLFLLFSRENLIRILILCRLRWSLHFVVSFAVNCFCFLSGNLPQIYPHRCFKAQVTHNPPFSIAREILFALIGIIVFPTCLGNKNVSFNALFFN